MTDIRYVKEPGTFLLPSRNATPASTGARQLLLGARLHVDESDNVNGRVPGRTMPDKAGKSHQGFVEQNRISPKQQLKIFYLDVGQGDATLIEAEGAVVIIDGGPNKGFHDELKERLASMRRADADAGLPARPRLHVNALLVTHFDKDHYNGLIKVLKSGDFEFGTLYHNGIPRYGDPADKDLNLGSLIRHADDSQSISADLRDVDSARNLLASGNLLTKDGNDNNFAKFLRAAVGAFDAGRLDAIKFLRRRDPGSPPETLPDCGPDLKLEVLGPLTTKTTGTIRLRAFPDPHDVLPLKPEPRASESHTVNGNSLVLRLTYGGRSFLFGGDLNQPAQAYLERRYPDMTPFAADVNKACHHGSSDFDLDFLKAVAPQATVFSSGDSGSYDHPLPDAMGAAARHSVGEFPLVFSTELARETGSGGIKLGHINARSNGNITVMAQKKEKPSTKKTWYTFPLPYPGPFGDSH